MILIYKFDNEDDASTANALKATFVLEEVILVSVSTVQNSNLPQITNQTNRGQTTGKHVPDSVMFDLYGVTIPSRE